VPLFISGVLGLGLVILVLVLRIWSCLHHWNIHMSTANNTVMQALLKN